MYFLCDGHHPNLGDSERCTRAEVSVALAHAKVAFCSDITNQSRLVAAVAEAGFQASTLANEEALFDHVTTASTRQHQDIAEWKTSFRRSLLSTIITLSSGRVRAWTSHRTNAQFLQIPAIIACGFSVMVFTSSIHREAAESVLHFRLNMSTLTSLALLCGFLESILAVRSREWGSASFDSLSTLVTVVLGGRLVKAILSQHALKASQTLADLVPREAELADRREDRLRNSATIPVSMLRSGDLVLVKPSSPVPADGIVVKGQPRFTSFSCEVKRWVDLLGSTT